MSTITLRVNGAVHTVDVEPLTPLLYVLRNDLGLEGPKFGCGLGQCGACTVIVNGVATRSCITQTSAGRGDAPEGLRDRRWLQPLQQAD
jgi:aerobic-type carbon monoxide dehydrogenase small subunit (CoxS/CutS family)